MSDAGGSLLDAVLSPTPPPFALIHRPESNGDAVEVLVGRAGCCERIDEIPLAAPGEQVLALLPYRQIAERQFPCNDDHEPIELLVVTQRELVPLEVVLRRLPSTVTTLADGTFDIPDEHYADIVRRIVTDEIGRGEGSNFVIRRSFVGGLEGDRHAGILSAYGRLLGGETGAYWTFLASTGRRIVLGATPERHISLSRGVASMSPISGTYRYPATGPVTEGMLRFLADPKERDELFMVVDEELKMMSRICPGGASVRGPFLREMGWLAHTEYFIEGPTDRGPHEVLRESLLAPAVTGSPLESACRVIARYEPTGRAYYSGVIALIGHDGDAPTVDSAILIRFAEVDRSDVVRIGVGATLVRHSDPESEVAETRAKATALLAALSGADTPSTERPGVFAVSDPLSDDPMVRNALRLRNDHVSRFWLSPASERRTQQRFDEPVRALVIDAEDDFTLMLAHQLSVLGLDIDRCRVGDRVSTADADLVVAGPGPGDPHDRSDRRIAALACVVDSLVESRRPFLALCLSHQLLCQRLGLPIRRRPVPNQGVQREIDLFGRREVVGFYNTFAAHCDVDDLQFDDISVEVCRDVRSGEVHALRAPTFVSLQFHVESVLTHAGIRLVGDIVERLLERREPAGVTPSTGRIEVRG